MKAYKITFCIGNNYKESESKSEVIAACNEREALRKLYLSLWGKPVFVYSIAKMYL